MSGGSYRIDPKTGERVLVEPPARSLSRAERRAAEQAAAAPAPAPAEAPKPTRRRKAAETSPAEGGAALSTATEE